MSEPTLYRKAVCTRRDCSVHEHWVKVEPDFEAMATEMNVDGWTCDGHEPGAWCEVCKRLQLSTVCKMWRAGLGLDE